VLGDPVPGEVGDGDPVPDGDGDPEADDVGDGLDGGEVGIGRRPWVGPGPG
jgi:hypothetical protein